MSVDGRVSLYSASLLPVITMSVLKHVPRLLFSEFLNKATDDGAYISSYDAAPSSHSKTHILNSIWIKSLDQAEQRDILWIRKCSLPYPSNRPIRQMKKKQQSRRESTVLKELVLRFYLLITSALPWMTKKRRTSAQPNHLAITQGDWVFFSAIIQTYINIVANEEKIIHTAFAEANSSTTIIVPCVVLLIAW